jgi:hypothetical protein
VVLSFRIRARQHCARDEEGFSIIEAVIAVSLLTIALLTVERGSIAALSATSVAKEHSIAASLVSGDIAQVVALPFADVQAGLNPTVDSLTSDPYITRSGSTYTFTLNGATIPATNTNTSEAPLVPHIATVTAGVPFSVATYPTVSSVAPGVVTVTVVVSWKAPTGGTDRVVGETEISSP